MDMCVVVALPVYNNERSDRNSFLKHIIVIFFFII